MKCGWIDLHLHLDGSVSADCLLRRAKKEGIVLPTYQIQELKEYLTVTEDCSDLNEYLRCFDLPLSVMQTEEGIYEITVDLLQRLAKQGLIYAEIRFAPQLHTKQGLTQEQAVKAALAGLSSQADSLQAQLILCCMRGEKNAAANRETLYIARKYLGNSVAAVDLAGAEAIYPTREYGDLFKEAKDLGLPFTIHAGEASDAQSVREAVLFGASRIGHGIHAASCEEVMQMIREREIALEVCPTSNLQTKAIQTLSELPIHSWLKEGICVTINTDNMTVSGTTIENEFALLFQYDQLTEAEAEQLIQNAVNAAFLPPREKEKLWTQIKEDKEKGL